MFHQPILLIFVTLIAGCWSDYSPHNNRWPVARNHQENKAADLSRAKRGGSGDDDRASPCCLLLEANLQTLEGSVNTLQGSVTNLEGTVNNIQGSVTTLEGSFDTLEGSVNTIEGSVSSLQGSVASLQGAFNGLTGSVNSLQGAVNSLSGTINFLQGLVVVLQASVNGLDTSVDNVQGSVDSLLGLVTDLQGDVDILMDAILNPDPLAGLQFLEENCLLAFRVTGGLGQNSYDRYLQTGYSCTADDDPTVIASVPAGCLTGDVSLPCDRHFRSRILDNWPSDLIDTVRVGVYDDGVEVQYIEFNGMGSTFDDWFSQARVTDSSWTDITTEPSNVFSIFGFVNSLAERRFYANRNFAGCPHDAGWLVVLEQQDDCSWSDAAPFPAILYSKLNTFANFNSATDIGRADALLITVKFKDGVSPSTAQCLAP